MCCHSSEGNFGHKGSEKDGHKGFGQDGGYGRGKGNAYGKGGPTLQRARFGYGATDHLLKDCPRNPSKIQLVQRYRVAGLSWEKVKGYGQRRECHDEVPHCGKVGGGGGGRAVRGPDGSHASGRGKVWKIERPAGHETRVGVSTMCDCVPRNEVRLLLAVESCWKAQIHRR